MKLVIQRGSVLHNSPEKFEDVKTTVIQDKHGNPILIATTMDGDDIIVTSVHDSQFKDVAATLGLDLNKTPAVTVKKL